MTAIRWLLSVSHRFKLKLTQLDVRSAFLNGVLDDDVFIKFPKGIPNPDNTKVLKLKKALYGLKIAFKTWNRKIHKIIMKLNYVRSITEPCIYFRNDDGSKISIALIYVDDLLLAENDDQLRKEFIKVLQSEFEIKIILNPECFIGIQLINDHNLIVHQRNYIEELVRMSNLIESRSVLMPMETSLNIQISDQGIENPEFRRIIGALLFIARVARPDISYSVNYLSKFAGKVTPEIMKYARRIIQYLNSTVDYVLTYRSNTEDTVAYIDASFAPDLVSCKSISGYLILHFGNIISWGTKKQNIVTTSSTAAEFVAIADTLPELMLVKYLNKEILRIDQPVLIKEDNISTKAIAETGERHRLRHVIIKNHYMLEAVEKGEIQIHTTEGKQQMADALTKAVTMEIFKKFVHFLFLGEDD